MRCIEGRFVVHGKYIDLMYKRESIPKSIACIDCVADLKKAIHQLELKYPEIKSSPENKPLSMKKEEAL